MGTQMELLTNEQLCNLAQAGNKQALELLIQNNLPFIQQTANRIVTNPLRAEQLASCGIEPDDLVQAGTIGLWKAVDSYEPASGNKFLTYAAKSIWRAMADLIREYSKDMIWRLKLEKMQILYLDEFIGESEETVRDLTADPRDKPLEQVCINSEALANVQAALPVLSERERSYIKYRFGFEDEESHPLSETAEHFRLTVSRAKKLESSALKLLEHEIFVVIPERRFKRSTRRLAKRLDRLGLLRNVELRIKTKKKRGKKITIAVCEYQADCDGSWGEFTYHFEDGSVDIRRLAGWDTTIRQRFVRRAVEHLRIYCKDGLPDKLMIPFVGRKWV